MMKNKGSQGSTYRIKIQGIVNVSSFDWISDIEIFSQENHETVFDAIFVDQPALRGFLDQLWNYNFKILSVERISKLRSKQID